MQMPRDGLRFALLGWLVSSGLTAAPQLAFGLLAANPQFEWPRVRIEFGVESGSTKQGVSVVGDADPARVTHEDLSQTHRFGALQEVVRRGESHLVHELA